ncbi:MAG: CRISPR-associated primase-polymerase type A1 [Myxococcota bacterium]
MPDPKALFLDGDLVAARTALLEALASPAPADPAGLARVAEGLGEATLAMRAWQLVLRQAPDDAVAWSALAELHQERGDRERAAVCRKRAGLVVPDAVEPEEPPADPHADEPSDSDLVRYCHLYSGREDLHARMWRNGAEVGYSPVEAPLTPELVRAHLAGSMTLGLYLVRADDTCSVVCFDIDATKAAIAAVATDPAAARSLRQELAAEGARWLTELRALGLDPILEDSGWKGRHLWCFLPAPVPAEAVCAWGKAVASALRPGSPRLAIESFPKQGKLRAGGVGNLVKLPLGLHLRSGRRSVLLDDAGDPLPSPMARLRQVRRIPLPTVPVSPPSGAAPPATVRADSEPPVVPMALPGAWSEADFDASPHVGPVMRGCAVIRATIEGALAERRLSRDAAVVLAHSLGHLPDGVRAVNYAYERVPGFPTELRMGAPHRGSPVSCARVRQRLHDVATRVGCDCVLPVRPGQYAHPLLHTDLEAARKPAARSLEETLEALARAQDRLRQVQEELGRLRAEAVEGLGRVPGGRWAVSGGEWVLEDDEGVPSLRWEG